MDNLSINLQSRIQTTPLDVIEEIKQQFIERDRNNENFKVLSCIVEHSITTNKRKVLEECCKLMAKFCSLGSEFQNKICQRMLNERMKSLIEENCENDDDLRLLLRILQLIGNCLVGNQSNKESVWSMFKLNLNSLFVEFVDRAKTTNQICIKIQDTLAMIFYNIFLTCPTYMETVPNEFVTTSISSYKLPESDLFSELLLRTLISTNHVFLDRLNSEDRLTVLGLIKETALEEEFIVNSEFIIQLTDCLESKLDVILNGNVPNSLEGAMETTILMEIFSTFGKCEDKMATLRGKRSLFVSVLYVLKSLHEVDRGKLRGIENLDANINADNPSVGFKRSIVRYIANVVYDFDEFDSLIIDSEIIPVLLECCQFDPLNPFIQQWAIFAISNLCKHSKEIQHVISQVKQVNGIKS